MIILMISFSVSGLLHGEAGLLGQEVEQAQARCRMRRQVPGLEKLGALGWDVDGFTLEEAPEGRGALAGNCLHL